jgi:hypothetical protein
MAMMGVCVRLTAKRILVDIDCAAGKHHPWRDGNNGL